MIESVYIGGEKGGEKERGRERRKGGSEGERRKGGSEGERRE